ncbi:MAG: hypothetical protein ACE5F1_09320 [Planctomycetota bacterium]
MSETNQDELHDLEPLNEFNALEEIVEPEKAAKQGPDMLDLLYKRSFAGMPAPAFNPMSSKEYFQFLLGGVLIVIGCLMPFDENWDHVGYKSFSGAMWLVIGLGVIWSMWGAINSGLFRARWVGLTILPFFWSILHLVQMDWGAFGEIFDFSKWQGVKSFSRLGAVLQEAGPGRLFIFLGSLYIEFTFVMGIIGGVKRKKEQDAARSASRRR